MREGKYYVYTNDTDPEQNRGRMIYSGAGNAVNIYMIVGMLHYEFVNGGDSIGLYIEPLNRSVDLLTKYRDYLKKDFY